MIMLKYPSNKAAMRVFHQGALAAMVAIGLSACGIAPTVLEDSYVPMNGSDKYPIEVAKGPVTLEVSSKYGTLQPNQINAVSAFSRSAMGNGFTGITLRRPSGGGASSRVASEIASVLQQMGMPGHMIKTATYPAAGNSPVQLSYVRTYAKTQECGNWNENLASTESNDSMLNHGCSVQANIAAMVVNPEVFVVPAPVTPASAASRMTGITTVYSGAVNDTGASTSTSSDAAAPSGQ